MGDPTTIRVERATHEGLRRRSERDHVTVTFAIVNWTDTVEDRLEELVRTAIR